MTLPDPKLAQTALDAWRLLDEGPDTDGTLWMVIRAWDDHIDSCYPDDEDDAVVAARLVVAYQAEIDRLTRENTVFRAAVVIEQTDDDKLEALLENTDVDDLLAFMRVCDAIGLAETPGE